MAGRQTSDRGKSSTKTSPSQSWRPRLTLPVTSLLKLSKVEDRAFILILLITFCFIAHSKSAVAQPLGAPPIEQLVEDLQKKYSSVQSFSARFEHRYSGGLIAISITEQGTVSIRKPGKMRWNYETADGKVYVSDGRTLYSHFPADRQVIVTPISGESQTSTAGLFLTDDGNLLEDFTASYEAQPETEQSWNIRLTPHSGDTDYEWIILTVDRLSLSITGLSTGDLQGGQSTYVFTDLKENPDFPDSLFQFEIPENTDVISNDLFN